MKMYMQKKIYELPALEVIEVESEPLVNGSITQGLNPDDPNLNEDENDVGEMSNKRQYGFNNAPWE